MKGTEMGSRLRFWLVVAGALFLAFSTGVSHPVSASSTSPDFYITTETNVSSVYQGSMPTANYVYVYSNAYFSGWVHLTASISPQVPNGPIVSFDTPDVYMIPSVTRTPGVLVETWMTSPLQTYNITVTANGGNLTRTASFNLTVIPPVPAGDFTVSVRPSTNTLQPGYAEGVTLAFAVNSGGVITSPLNVGVSSSPHGALETSGLPSQLSFFYLYTFIVASSASASPGTYTLNVTATEPAVSQSMTGWKPAVTRSGTTTITVGSNPSCCTAQPAPLVYDLGFAGSSSPGQTIQLVNSFTNHSTYPATITSVSINTDLANQDLNGTLRLPVTLAAGASVSLGVSMSISSNASLGPHTMTVTVQWTSTDPYFNSGGWWAQSPIAYQKDLMVVPYSPPQGPTSQGILQILTQPPTIYYIATIGGAALATALTVTVLIKKDRAQRTKQPQATQVHDSASSQSAA